MISDLPFDKGVIARRLRIADAIAVAMSKTAASKLQFAAGTSANHPDGAARLFRKSTDHEAGTSAPGFSDSGGGGDREHYRQIQSSTDYAKSEGPSLQAAGQTAPSRDLALDMGLLAPAGRRFGDHLTEGSQWLAEDIGLTGKGTPAQDLGRRPAKSKAAPASLTPALEGDEWADVRPAMADEEGFEASVPWLKMFGGAAAAGALGMYGLGGGGAAAGAALLAKQDAGSRKALLNRRLLRNPWMLAALGGGGLFAADKAGLLGDDA